MTTTSYDAIILGAGQGGGPLAGALARAGRRTLLIERAHAGGTCVNVGCTPTKTYLASTRVAALARRARRYGIGVGAVVPDLAAVRARVDGVVRSFREGSERGLARAGVEIARGHGRFVAARTLAVQVGDGPVRTVEAPVVVISTGLRPAWPDLPGLDAVGALDSTAIQRLDDVPAHLLVLGAGYVGLEFAQLFRRLGSRVTVVDAAPRLLPREDEDIAAALGDLLRADGLEFLLGRRPVEVARAHGVTTLTLADAATGARTTVAGSDLLVAAGRVPNTDDIGAAAAGIALDARGFVTVDDRLRTSVPGVFAIGDVKGGPAFTHAAYDDFRILRANLLDGADRSTAGRVVPSTLFTDPPLGRIGLTEREARAAGHDVRVAVQPMAHVARAIEQDETAGLMKAVVDARTDRLLGAAVLGLEGGEMATFFQLAMMGGLPVTALRDAVFPHPSLAESLNNLFAALG